MTKDDILSVLKLEEECFSAPWNEKTLIEELSNPTAMFYVAKDRNKIVGYIGANNISGEVFMTNVAVTSSFRRRGAATLLLETLIKSCKAQRASYAIKLYEKMSFRKVGERKNFYSFPTEDAILYTLDFCYEQD